jgi:FkbM family methyltransferase
MTSRSLGLATARFIAPLFAFRAARSALDNATRFLEALQGIGTGAEFTRREFSSIFRQIKEDAPIIFDVGAHTGQFLQEALARAASDCEIHAFEPATASFSVLHEKFGTQRRVHLNRCGLSGVAGSGVLFYPDPSSQLASLTPRQRFGVPQSECVQLATMDEYCQANGITHIEMLKLDVEGHELEVLEGAIELLNRKAIQRVVLEFGGCNVDTRVFFRDIYEFMTANGMRLARLTPSGAFQAIEKYGESLERFKTTNYLATLL